MKLIQPDRWRWIVASYAIGGLALGLGDPLFRGIAGRALGNVTAGTWCNIVIAMTLLNVFLAAVHPRFRVVLAGALASAVAFVVGIAIAHGAIGKQWPLWTLLKEALLVMGIAAAIYTLLGVATTRAVSRWRRVGLREPGRCERCGYLLRGLPEPRCPECGEPFDPLSAGVGPAQSETTPNSGSRTSD